jgi:hypothetical protein
MWTSVIEKLLARTPYHLLFGADFRVFLAFAEIISINPLECFFMWHPSCCYSATVFFFFFSFFIFFVNEWNTFFDQKMPQKSIRLPSVFDKRKY